MICPECDQEFTPKNNRVKYCSVGCRLRYNNRIADKRKNGEMERPAMGIEKIRKILMRNKRISEQPYQFYQGYK